jgi:hypothetical protein
MDVVLTKIPDRHAYVATRDLDDGSTMAMMVSHRSIVNLSTAAREKGIDVDKPKLEALLADYFQRSEEAWRALPLETRRHATELVMGYLEPEA